MSQAIIDLGLEQPPVTLWRVSGDRYVAVCMCGYRTNAAKLISVVMHAVGVHGRQHRRLTPAEILDVATRKAS